MVLTKSFVDPFLNSHHFVLDSRVIPSGEIRSQSLSGVNGLIEITTWNKFSIRLQHFSAVIFMCNDVTKKKVHLCCLKYFNT